MKVLSLLVLIVVLTLAAAPAFAAEDGNSAVPKMCKGLQESAPEIFDWYYTSLGDCVSDLTNRQDDVAHRCQLDYFLDYYGYESTGECVSAMRT